MNDDREDPVLDACLDEVLGGCTPPDLSARILRALSLRASQAPAQGIPHNSPPVLPHASAYVGNGNGDGRRQVPESAETAGVPVQPLPPVAPPIVATFG